MTGVTVQKVEKPEDAKFLLPLLREFFKDTQQAKFVELEEDGVVALVSSLIENKDSAAVFVAVEDRKLIGCTGAMLYPLWFAPSHLTGQEMFWYVDRDRRKSKAGKKLFQALEDWARKMGANSFAMSTLSHLDEKRIAQMYESKGYVPYERAFVKEL